VTWVLLALVVTALVGWGVHHLAEGAAAEALERAAARPRLLPRALEEAGGSLDSPPRWVSPPPARVAAPWTPQVQDGATRVMSLGQGEQAVEIRFPVIRENRSGYRLSLTPELDAHRRSPRLRLEDIQLGAPAFDPLFLIRSNHAGATRRLLDPEAASCPVCGEGMDPPEVACVACASPHHQECWTYAGGCSTYGCLARQSRPWASAAS